LTEHFDNFKHCAGIDWGRRSALAPISGIDGDVRDPSNIIWLRHAHPDTYVQSLADAGLIDLAINNA